MRTRENRAGIRFLAMVASALFAQTVAASPIPHASTSIGMEHPLELELAVDGCRPLPANEHSASMLRIAGIRPSGNGEFLYDLRFTGFEPGTYDILDHLRAPDGGKLQGPEVMVEVRSVLPSNHNGSLYEHKSSRLPIVGGYRMTLGLLSSLWLAATAYGWRRLRKPQPLPVPLPPAPSWEEQVRPLVEAAAAGTLNHAGKAKLEGMLVSFWREKLGDEPMPIKEELARLRTHPEAGKLLEALETWLHRRGSAPQLDVERLLAPYRPQIPPPTAAKP